jgi:hypothetical protein
MMNNRRMNTTPAATVKCVLIMYRARFGCRCVGDSCALVARINAARVAKSSILYAECPTSTLFSVTIGIGGNPDVFFVVFDILSISIV